MGWTYSVIWLVFVSGCECWPLSDTDPAMAEKVQSPQQPQPDPAVNVCGEPEPLLNGRLTYLSVSVVQYHCNEPFYSLAEEANATFTCGADGKWKSSHDSVATPVCLAVCGRPTQTLTSFERVLGGSSAPADTFPWQVLVKYGWGSGGGMVIADRWIMTAAHVVAQHSDSASSDLVRIYLGVTDQSLMESPVDAASVHIHPDYSVSYDNDIALIKIQDPITFNASVMPICLPSQNASYAAGSMGLLSGYGRTKTHGPIPKQLQYVPLPVVDQETCINSFGGLKSFRGNRTKMVTDNMFCAGLPEGGKDSCAGDGGSPFVLKENGQFWVAGISSWGVGCGNPGFYGVYTRVHNYLDWIKKTMQEN